MKDKMVIIDGTDIMIIGGYGNASGNLNLLKYSNDEIKEMIKENNDEEDNIRLIQSLLKTIRWQKQQLEEEDKVIDEINKYCEDDNKYWGNDDYINGKNEENKIVKNDILEILERGKNGK